MAQLNNAWNAMEQYGDQEKNEHRDADVTGGYWEYTLNGMDFYPKIQLISLFFLTLFNVFYH